MGEEIFQIGGRVVTLGEALVLAGAAVAVLLLVALLIAWRRALARAERGQAFEARVADLVRAQTEMQGRMQTMAEVFGSRQSELVRGLSERMDGLGHRLGQTMSGFGSARRSTSRYQNASNQSRRPTMPTRAGGAVGRRPATRRS